nr:sulfotransferase [Mangrovicoccus ximenensis]
MEKLLFCAGMPRCGTTWLNAQLIAHPAIPRIPRKEIHYFMRQYGSVDRLTEAARQAQFRNFAGTVSIAEPADPRGVAERVPMASLAAGPADAEGYWAPDGPCTARFDRLAADMHWYLRYLQGPVCDAWYRRLFDGVGPQQWALDFSTTNGMVVPEGFGAMAGFAPDARAILVLRNPLDRLWSHMRLQDGLGRRGRKLPEMTPMQAAAFIRQHHLMGSSLYAPVVEGVMRAFAPEKRLILSFDRIVSDPAGVVGEVLDFLGLGYPQRLRRLVEQRVEGRARSGGAAADPALLSAMVPSFRRDLEKVAGMGVEMVAPWLDDLGRHAPALQAFPERSLVAARREPAREGHVNRMEAGELCLGRDLRRPAGRGRTGLRQVHAAENPRIAGLRRSRDQKHRPRRGAHDALHRGARDHVPERAGPVHAHHHQIGVLLLDHGGQAGHRLAQFDADAGLDARRGFALQFAARFFENGARHLLGQLRVDDGANDQPGAMRGGQLFGAPPGTRGAQGKVGAYQNRLHVECPPRGNAKALLRRGCIPALPAAVRRQSRQSRHPNRHCTISPALQRYAVRA